MKNQSSNNYSEPSFHPFRIPPSLQLAYLHRQCSQFGEAQTLSEYESSSTKYSICPCCNQPPRNKLNVLCNIASIYEISEPVGYYFTFLKVMGLALLLIMLGLGIYTLIQIINQCGSAVNTGDCLKVYGIYIPRIHVFFKTPLIILNIVVIIFLYMVSAYLFFKHAYIHQKIICNNEKPSDFSALISGVIHEKIDKVSLEGFFQEFAIQDIIYTYKISKYMKKLSEKSVLTAKRDLYCSIQEKSEYDKYQKMIHKIDDKLLHIKNKFILGHDVELRTDKIIITFGTAVQKQRFSELYSMKMCQNIYHSFCGTSPLTICEQPLYIQPLGQPYQIIWENLEFKSKTRYLRILVSNLISVVILLGSFVGITFLSKAEKDRDTVGDVLMSILFAVLIQVVNSILVFTISSLTSWEKRYTKTGEISIMFYKKCIAFFLNTTFLPFCLFLFSLFQPEQDDLIRNIFTIFFISNLITPIVGFYVHPRFLYRLYERSQIKKELANKNCIRTQIKTNAIFEKLTFMLDERYALASQLITNCMFYAAIFPIGIFITVIGIIITYWSSKFWLLRYCSLPKFSYRIGRNINYICCFFPCIYSFGYAANLYMVKYSVDFNRSYSIYMAACTIPISILFLLFGEKVAVNYIKNNRASVAQCLNKKSALFSYKTFNPTTFLHSNVGIQKIQKWLKKKEKNDKINSSGVESGGEEKQKGVELRTNIWDNLISYAIAKQMGVDFGDEDFDEISSISSRRSSIGNKRNSQRMENVK